jgi:DNA-binding CsgD family transcriptional regulator
MRSKAERDELELGKLLAESLTPLKSQYEVARELGISREAVRRIERRALAKVAAQLKELANAGRN